MGKIHSISTAIAILATSLVPAAYAQDATTEAPAEGAQAQPATRAQKPQEITAAVHGSWQIRCVTTEPRQCFLYQLIINDRNSPLMEITLVPANDETGQDVQMVATTVTPLGVILGRGLIMQIDDHDPVQRPYSWCAPLGCYSRFPLNGTEIEQLQSGTQIATSMFMVQNPQQDIELSLPLDGFKAAYDELMKIEEEQKQ